MVSEENQINIYIPQLKPLIKQIFRKELASNYSKGQHKIRSLSLSLSLSLLKKEMNVAYSTARDGNGVTPSIAESTLP